MNNITDYYFRRTTKEKAEQKVAKKL